MDRKLIQTKEELRELAKKLGVRQDWHEPDNQEVTAEVRGTRFDNAGFYGLSFEAHNLTEKLKADSLTTSVEQYVVLRQGDKVVAQVNLATLFALACE